MNTSLLSFFWDLRLLTHFSLRSTNLRRQADDTKPVQAAAWKTSITRTIAILDAIVQTTYEHNSSQDTFEETVNARIVDDSLQACYDEYNTHDQSSGHLTVLLKPEDLSKRLQKILQTQLPLLTYHSADIMRTSSRPPLLVRYWLPAALLLVGAVLRSLLLRSLTDQHLQSDFVKCDLPFHNQSPSGNLGISARLREDNHGFLEQLGN